MTKKILRKLVLSLLMAAVAGLPAQLLAQDTNKAATPKPAAGTAKGDAKAEKKPVAGPFRGKLAAMDKVAKTITVGKRTIQITSETKIKRAGKPATFEDGVVGEEASGYVKPTPDGKWLATTVNYGPKAASPSAEKTKPAEKKTN